MLIVSIFQGARWVSTQTMTLTEWKRLLKEWDGSFNMILTEVKTNG